MIFKKLCFSILALSVATNLLAQTPTKEDYVIAVARPTVSAAFFNVPVGVFQFETGYHYSQQRVNLVGDYLKTDVHTIPNIYFRTGITQRWELALGWGLSKANFSYGTSPITGSTDVQSNMLNVGSRVRIIEQAKGLIPEMAIYTAINLPFTLPSSSRNNVGIGTTLRFCMRNTLSEKMSIFYNLGAEFAGSSTNMTTSGVATLGLGYSILPQLSCFLEGYGFFPYQSESRTLGLNGGLAYRIGNAIRLDLAGGIDHTNMLTENRRVFFTVGFSACLK